MEVLSPRAGEEEERRKRERLALTFDNPKLADKLLLFVPPVGRKRKADAEEAFDRLHVSSQLLAVSSAFFMSLFTNVMKGSADKEVRLIIDPDAGPLLRDALRWLYTRSFETPISGLLGVVCVADQYGLSEVVAGACDTLLSADLTLPLALEWLEPEWKLVEACKRIVQKAETFVAKRFQNLATEYSSVEFLGLPPTAFLAILSSEQLDVESENIVLRAVMHWWKQSDEDTYGAIKEILQAVRFPQLDQNVLIDIAVPFLHSIEVPEWEPNACRDIAEGALAFKGCEERRRREDARFAALVYKPRPAYKPSSKYQFKWSAFPAEPQQYLCSPTFECRGFSWHIVIDFGYEGPGSFGIYLYCEQKTWIKLSMMFSIFATSTDKKSRLHAAPVTLQLPAKKELLNYQDSRAYGSTWPKVKAAAGSAAHYFADETALRLDVTLDLKVFDF